MSIFPSGWTAGIIIWAGSRTKNGCMTIGFRRYWMKDHLSRDLIYWKQDHIMKNKKKSSGRLAGIFEKLKTNRNGRVKKTRNDDLEIPCFRQKKRFKRHWVDWESLKIVKKKGEGFLWSAFANLMLNSVKAQYQRTGTADKPYCMSGNRTRR